MRRNAWNTAVLTITAGLGIMTAAWATLGPTGALGVEDSGPVVALRASAPGALLANSREGQPILVARGMAPGESRAGDVTISNTSDGDAAISLVARDLVDAPSATPLSALLDLDVSDVTAPATPRRVWIGKLRALTTPVALGTYPAGSQHVYRLTVTFPGGRPPALDNPYQGASTSLGFAWSSTPATSPPDDDGGGNTGGGDTGGSGETPVIVDHVEPSRNPGYLKLRVYVRRVQAAHRKRVYVNVFCSHGCKLTATGVVSLPSQKKKWKLKALKGSVKKAGTVKFRMPLPKKALPVLNQALLHRKKASVKLKITATSGKQVVRWTRTIHLAR